jgi:hypothetical protein
MSADIRILQQIKRSAEPGFHFQPVEEKDMRFSQQNQIPGAGFIAVGICTVRYHLVYFNQLTADMLRHVIIGIKLATACRAGSISSSGTCSSSGTLLLPHFCSAGFLSRVRTLTAAGENECRR